MLDAPVAPHRAHSEFHEPVPPSERIATLDVLRGLALLGVLVANIWLWFSGINFRFPDYAAELQQLSLDTAAFLLIAFFVSGKALTTFAFLFGLGFAIQIFRAQARGVSPVPVYARRLAILLAIGAIHGVFLWYGDILFDYAALGFLLLLFRNTPERRLLAWAAVFIVVVPLLLPAARAVRGAGATTPAESEAIAAEASARNQEYLDAFASAEPARIVAANLRLLPRRLLGPNPLADFRYLGLFLLGLYVGRRGILRNPTDHRQLLRRVTLVGFLIGLVFTALEMPLRAMEGQLGAWGPLALNVAVLCGTVPLAAAYVAAATLLFLRPGFRRWLLPFAPVGRMALTNYLAQTVICITIFYGGGLIGTVGPAVGLAIAVPIFAAQMVASRWWLSRYRFGPMEWVWRSATYGRLQPLRLESTVRPAPV